MEKIRAIILAAGRGSRMQNSTLHTPKCLHKINNKSLLSMQIDNFKKSKIEDIAIVTGYKKELLEEFHLTSFNNINWETTNMVSSLDCASSWLNKYTCIISYADIFYNRSAITSLIKDPSPISITYDINWISLWKKRFDNPMDDAETFKIDKNSELIEIGNKPRDLEDIEGQYMGLLKFNPKGWSEFKEIWEEVKKINKKISMTEMLQKIIISKKIGIKCIKYADEWGEVDLQTDLSLYNRKKV